jgi:ATP-dependent DNA ligase
MKRNLNNIIVDKGSIIDKDTGEILGATSPKFSNWDYAKYLEEFNKTKEVRFLEPMTAQELDEDKLQKHLAENRVVGEQKFDGHRGLVFITSKGNRIFSRRVSKQTGWYAENTDCMPHIRDIVVPEDLYGTVIDGEILLPIENCSCRQVQSVTGALPETAIKYQLENGFAYLCAFDILYYKGINIQKMPLWKRKYTSGKCY